MPRDCVAKNCSARSTYGFCQSTIYCLKHSKGDIVEFPADELALCKTQRCKNLATFGYANTSSLVCQAHSNDGYAVKKTYANKKGDKCSVFGCDALIKLGFGNSTGLFCKDHFTGIPMTELGTTGVRGTCVENRCKNPAVYGTASSGKASLCGEHSSGEIFDINNKHLICKADGCTTRASYGLIGGSIERCYIHRSDGMEDLNSTKCDYVDPTTGESCKTQPVFGFDKPCKCAKHIVPGMVDLRSQQCEVEGCTTQAAYGYDRKIRCGKHKEGMPLTYTSQMCKKEGCSKLGWYGLPGGRGEYCSDHKSNEMVNTNCSKCSEKGCDLIASFGYDSGDRTRERCSTHHLPGMVQLSSRMCSECNFTTVNSKYRPYCYSCYADKFPNNVTVINHRTKEKEYARKLLELYPDGRANREIEFGVSRHRPDFLIELDDRAIIIEIDEDQHNREYSYSKDSEDCRNQCLRESIGKPIIMIRLNPDSYHKNGSVIGGSFMYVHDRLAIEPDEFGKRFEELANVITEQIHSDDIEDFQEIYLFFNE